MMLQYNDAYHMHCQLLLRSGRTLTLPALEQSMTYAGQLAGIPYARVNDRYIMSAMGRAEQLCLAGTKPRLLEPLRRDYLDEPGDMAEVAEDSPDCLPQWLPRVRCIASFHDIETVRDRSKDFSVLTVVWFQDEYALPILEPALSQLLATDWKSLATDIEFG